MNTSTHAQSQRTKQQQVFREMVFGTLVYAVVLGFFADYTDLLETRSFSATFAAALVLQLLTYATLLLKNRVVSFFKSKTGRFSKIGLVFGVWLILFFSKFVFLAIIDVIFGENVNISGFVGLLVIIIVMTVVKQAIDSLYNRLGRTDA